MDPKCISEMCVKYKPGRSLRAAGDGQLAVPRVEIKQGEMAFSRYAVHCRIQLLMEIRSAPCFKKKLKKTDSNQNESKTMNQLTVVCEFKVIAL